MAKFFGDHKAFSAMMTTEVARTSPKDTFTTPIRMFFLDGKSRMEVDVTKSKGSSLPEGMGTQLKTMGLSDTTIISDPAKALTYIVYPGLESYAEMKGTNTTAGDPAEMKVEVTELGKETVEGHDCVKNKVVVTDADGKKQEATVWNATDLRKFPVRIETSDEGGKATMVFSDVSFVRPAASLFTPPEKFTRYESIQTLIQQGVMMRMQGGRALPKPPGQ